MAPDLAALIQLMETGKLPYEYTHGIQKDTSSLSIIESENVGTKSMQLLDTYKEIGKQPRPSRYADMARLMDISMEAPQEYKDKMSTLEFTLKGLYSRTLEKAAYATAEPVWKTLKAGAKAIGLDKMASYFDDRLEASQVPPVTQEFDEQIAILLDSARKKGKFHEATAMLGYSVMEALAYLTRMGLVKAVPGIGSVIPSGAEMPKEAAQMFTGLGTLADVKRHATVLGTMGMMETPGDMVGRMQGAVYRIAYNITPFIANATPFTGWGARATDTMLNMFLSSKSYINAFQTSKDPGEFFVKAIPEFASDVIFALNTKGSAINQRAAQMGKLPGLTKLTRTERINILKNADKLSEPTLDYGAGIKPTTDKKVALDTVKINLKYDKLTDAEKDLNVKGVEGTTSVEAQGLIKSTKQRAKYILPPQEKGGPYAVMMTKSELKRRKSSELKAIKDEKINVCLRAMEESGKVPDYVRDKISKELDTWWTKSKAGSMSYVMNNRLVENVAGMIDRFMPWGPNHKVIYQDMNDAFGKELTGNHTKVDTTREFLQPLLGKKGINDALLKRRLVGEFSLTDDDIMAVAYGSQDKGVRNHLKKGNGFTDKEILECINIVKSTPNLKTIVDWTRERYKEAYGPLTQAYKAHTGKELPKRPFYMHVPVDKENATFEKDNIAEQMMQRKQMGDHAYVTKNITKARVARSNLPINLGLISNYIKYTREAEHYKAFVGPVKNMSSLINDPRYKQALDKNMGKATWSVLNKYMKDVAGTKTGTDWDGVEKSFNMIRRHTGVAMIGLNLLSGLRQPLSSLQACGEIGLYHVLNGIGQIAQHPRATEKFIYERSAPAKYRGGIFERFMAEERQAEKIVTLLTEKLTTHKAAMKLVTIMDKWTVLAVWKGTYDRIMTTGKTIDGDRIKNDDLERVAIKEADRVVRKTQPSASPQDLPGFHRGGPLARMFTMFQNQTNKNLNYFEYDIYGKYKAGKITAATAGYKVLFAYVLPMILLGMIARGRFPKTKEDIIKDMVRYPLSGAFMVGGLINSAIDDYGQWAPPPLAGMEAGRKALAAISKLDVEKTGKYGIQAAAILSGIPYNQLYRTWKGTLALMNNETDDWRRLIWSEYALTKGLPKKKKVRPYVYPRTPRVRRKGR